MSRLGVGVEICVQAAETHLTNDFLILSACRDVNGMPKVDLLYHWSTARRAPRTVLPFGLSTLGDAKRLVGALQADDACAVLDRVLLALPDEVALPQCSTAIIGWDVDGLVGDYTSGEFTKGRCFDRAARVVTALAGWLATAAQTRNVALVRQLRAAAFDPQPAATARRP
jgi:hypothetical protein